MNTCTEGGVGVGRSSGDRCIADSIKYSTEFTQKSIATQSVYYE